MRNLYVDGLRSSRRAQLVTSEPSLDEAPADVASERLRGDLELEQLKRLVAEDIEQALASLSEEAARIPSEWRPRQ